MSVATLDITCANDVAARYERDGFVSPIDVMSAADAQTLRADLESAEAQLADDPSRLALLRSYPDRLLPLFDQLIRNGRLTAAASAVLGPDLMVWSAGLFIKDANSPKVVTWHQDLTYWGLDDAQQTTCWVALSSSNRASGCMKFIPGSHKHALVAHVDTFDDNNLLSRGQEVAVEVDAAKGVAVELKTGQASMHHGHLFHASDPNTTSDRRIGVAIRYIKPSMKQRSGDRSLVALVGGEDRHEHFTIAKTPVARLSEQDFQMCRRDSEIKRRVLYEGAQANAGQRY